MSRTFLILFLMVLLVGVASPGLATNTPTLELETAVHFLTPGGEDVQLEAGIYEVEATDTGLKLLPEGGARTDIILLEAIVGDHEEPLDTPAVRYGPAEDQEDVIHLALLLPNGTGHEAVGSYSGIRPRGLAFKYVRASKRSYRSSSFTVRKSPRRSRRNRPVDCGPFVNDLKGKYLTNPAIASFKGKLHLVTRFSGPNLLFGKNPKNNKLWHATYDGKRWSTARQLKNHSSKTRVALATFENRLHMVFLGGSSNALRHSTFDGRRWTYPKKIPNQSSKNTPALASFKGILYTVYWDHKSKKLMGASFTNKNKWKFPKPHSLPLGKLLRISPGLFVRDDELYMVRGMKFGGTIRVSVIGGKPNRFGDFKPNHIPFAFVEPTKVKKLKAISVTKVKGPKKSTEFIMMLNQSNKLFYTNFRMMRQSKHIKQLERPFLNQKSKTTAALAFFDRCIHTVFVQKSSGKLRHVKFDVARLR